MSDLQDIGLERAHAAEAVFDHGRFVAAGLCAADFEAADVRQVIEAAGEAWEAGEAGLDGTIRALQRHGRLERVGGAQGVSALLSSGGAPDAKRVRELARLRKLRELGVRLASAAGAGDLGAAMAAANEAVAAGLSSNAEVVVDGMGLIRGLMEQIEAVQRGGKGRALYPGMPALERCIIGLPPATLMVVGADTGAGKSTFVTELILGSAERGQPAGLISVEDDFAITGSRVLGALSGLVSTDIMFGRVRPDDMGRMGVAIERVRTGVGTSTWWSDRRGGTEIDIMAAMSNMAAKGVKLFVVDYLQEIKTSARNDDVRRLQIAHIASSLKHHAGRLGGALVLVTQLSRPKDQKTGARPTRHMIKESGDVSNSAEVILLMWRSDDSPDALTNVVVDKCTWGGQNKWFALTRNESGRFVEVSP